MQKGEYKYFKPHDIIIYALVLVLFVLSCVFVTTSRGDSGERFELLYKNEVILKADFDGFSEYNENYVAKKSKNEYEIVTERGKNLLKIDFTSQNAKFTEADCHGEECLAMNLKTGGVVCAPHSLVLRYERDYDPTVG